MDLGVERLRFERGGRTVLDVPRLGFRTGTTTALFGPNGSGKTTLLRLIAGLERPTEGRILVTGTPGVPRPPEARDIAFGFQEPVFVRGTVRQNLDLALGLRLVPAAERAARTAEVARECGIETVLDRPARQLSGGEARRAALARTLALRAPIALLDEPLAGIDRVTRLSLLDDLPRLLATFASTTLLVTHDREEAFRLAEHLVVLVDGQVRAAGPKAVVYAHPPDRATAELLGYTVLPLGGRLVAVPTGTLRPVAEGSEMSGSPVLWMAVERVVDMGHHRHAVGTVDGERVDLVLPHDLPAPLPGTRVPITAAGAVMIP